MQAAEARAKKAGVVERARTYLSIVRQRFIIEMDANRLRIVDVFAGFDDRELSLPASVMHERSYVPLQSVFQKETALVNSYVVLAGSIEVTVTGRIISNSGRTTDSWAPIW